MSTWCQCWRSLALWLKFDSRWALCISSFDELGWTLLLLMRYCSEHLYIARSFHSGLLSSVMVEKRWTSRSGCQVIVEVVFLYRTCARPASGWAHSSTAYCRLWIWTNCRSLSDSSWPAVWAGLDATTRKRVVKVLKSRFQSCLSNDQGNLGFLLACCAYCRI